MGQGGFDLCLQSPTVFGFNRLLDAGHFRQFAITGRARQGFVLPEELPDIGKTSRDPVKNARIVLDGELLFESSEADGGVDPAASVVQRVFATEHSE